MLVFKSQEGSKKEPTGEVGKRSISETGREKLKTGCLLPPHKKKKSSQESFLIRNLLTSLPLLVGRRLK